MAAPLEQQKDFAATYGWSLAVLRMDPDLSKLFDRAVSGGYNQARFVAELRNTKWYKTRSESVRQGTVLAKADPAEYQRRLQAAAASVADQYFQMTGRKMSGPTAAHLGKNAFLFGMTDAEIRDMVGNTVSSAALMKGGIGGTLGEAERQIRTAAEDYGLSLSPTTMNNALNNIAWQNTDASTMVDQFRQAAKSRYAAFAKQIDQGMTVREIADPYKQLMAKTLEISDKSISTNDKFIQSALTYRPMVGKKPGPPQAMALWQFEENLKNDPRWNKTQNAQDSIMAAGRKVLADMGLTGATGGN